MVSGTGVVVAALLLGAASSTTGEQKLPDAPKGGVWLFGVKAYSPITKLFAYSVDLEASPVKITSSHEIPLMFNSSLVPTTREWAQDRVNGKLIMWHTISSSETDGCVVETVRVPSAPGTPRLESTWIVPPKYCVRGARIALNPRTPSSVYVVLRTTTHPTDNPMLIKISGPSSGVGAARVSEVSTKIPLGVSGPIAIDPYFHNLYIVNTSLLVQTQNLVKVSTISGDVSVESRPIETETTRLSAIEFNPKKMGVAYGAANYNEQSGRMVRLDVSSSNWKVTKLGYTPSAYSYKYDFTSTPITAYGGGPSGVRWYDPSHPNPPLASTFINEYWNYGTVFPYMM